jgi:membrane-associated phospholipid phosphatase
MADTAGLPEQEGIDPPDVAVVSPGPPPVAPSRPPVTWKHEAEKVAQALLLFSLYLLIGRGEAALDVTGHRLDTRLDHALPFSAPWIFAYTAFWLFAISPLFYVRRPPYFRRLFTSIASTMVGAYAVFVFFPTTNDLRPALAGLTGFAPWLVGRIYTSDVPYNCFPSLHVALSCVAASSIAEVDRRAGIGAWFLAALIVLSTVLLKQHYLADVAAGALLAFVAHWFTMGRYARRSPPEPDDRRSRWVLGALAALQVAGMALVFVWYRVKG